MGLTELIHDGLGLGRIPSATLLPRRRANTEPAESFHVVTGWRWVEIFLSDPVCLPPNPVEEVHKREESTGRFSHLPPKPAQFTAPLFSAAARGSGNSWECLGRVLPCVWL